MTQKRFSKTKWLQSANKQVEDGFLSEREANDALVVWVNDANGKMKTQLSGSDADGECWIRDEWVCVGGAIWNIGYSVTATELY